MYWGSLGGKVPIGLLSTNWGGTPIEAWMPVDAINSCAAESRAPDDQVQREDLSWNPDRRRAGDADPNSPAALYNTMLAPLQHMSITGALWYQGESNVGSSLYPCLQDAMLTTWRGLFGGDMAFIFTQLSTWTAGGMGYVPAFRMNQVATLDLPAHKHRAGIDSSGRI